MSSGPHLWDSNGYVVLMGFGCWKCKKFEIKERFLGHCDVNDSQMR